MSNDSTAIEFTPTEASNITAGSDVHDTLSWFHIIK